MRSMDDVLLDGRVVLVRVDFNISVGSNGKVDEDEDYRLEAALPTIRELQQRRCRIVLLTHVGEFGENLDLKPIQNRLADLLKEDIASAKHLYGNEVKTKVAALEPGGILLLPNVRSDSREKVPNEQFGKQLSEVADIYINEAFSVCHREHTSVVVLPSLLPSCAGRRTIQEVEVLEKLKQSPEHPYVAVVSGAKIETKEKLIRSLLQKVDMVCIGGQLANVFLCAQKKYVSNVFTASDCALAESLLQEAGDKIVLPLDIVIGADDGHNAQTVLIDAIPEGTLDIWDLGPQSVQKFAEVCSTAKTVMWNGPLGRFEVKEYAEGTYAFAKLLANQKSFRVLGGGETVTSLEQLNLVSKFDHVSVGGGAMVTYLEGGSMPGLAPLYG